jgi:hypothetical protein
VIQGGKIDGKASLHQSITVTLGDCHEASAVASVSMNPQFASCWRMVKVFVVAPQLGSVLFHERFHGHAPTDVFGLEEGNKSQVVCFVPISDMLSLHVLLDEVFS